MLTMVDNADVDIEKLFFCMFDIQSSESKALITFLVVFFKTIFPAFFCDYVVTLRWTSIRAVINQNTSSNCKTSPVNKNTKFLPYIICLLFFKQVLLLLVSISSPEIAPLHLEWLKENLGFRRFSMSRTWFKCPGKISSKTEF